MSSDLLINEQLLIISSFVITLTLSTFYILFNRKLNPKLIDRLINITIFFFWNVSSILHSTNILYSFLNHLDKHKKSVHLPYPNHYFSLIPFIIIIYSTTTILLIFIKEEISIKRKILREFKKKCLETRKNYDIELENYMLKYIKEANLKANSINEENISSIEDKL